ncbi:hypothetical protein ACFTTN_07815 [Streptomyces niveus]
MRSKLLVALRKQPDGPGKPNWSRLRSWVRAAKPAFADSTRATT